MTIGTQLYSPREFLTKLQEGQIGRPIVFTGMAKANDQCDDELLFAHASNCENWIRIPLSSILQVEVLDIVPCKDHTHPLVRLHLKRPETEEGILFSSLADVSSIGTSRRLSLLRIQRREDSIKQGKDNCDDCPTWLEEADGRWCFVGCDETSCIYRWCGT
jgi:hypothetical protein